MTGKIIALPIAAALFAADNGANTYQANKFTALSPRTESKWRASATCLRRYKSAPSKAANDAGNVAAANLLLFISSAGRANDITPASGS